MTGLVDRAAAVERIGLPVTGGPPTRFGENFEAELQAVWRSDTVLGSTLALARAYDREIERVFEEKNVRLPNPLTSAPAAGGPQTPAAKRAREAEFMRAVRELGVEPKTPEDIREDAFGAIRERRALADRIGARATFTGELGGFAGGMAAVTADPPVLATMALGAPVTAGVLRTAAIEAGIGVATEAVLQPTVQGRRAAAGLPAGLEEALANVALAGAGGAALGGLVKGAAVGARALVERARGRREDLSAEGRGAVDRAAAHQAAMDGNPFPDTRAGRAAHIAAQGEAEAALAGGPAPQGLSAGQRADLPVRLEPEGRLGPEAFGLDADPALRQAFDQARGWRREMLEAAQEAELRRGRAAAARTLAEEGTDLEGIVALARSGASAGGRAVPRGVSRLASALRAAGGVRADGPGGGEIRNIVSARQRPGLINSRGMTPEAAAEFAAEEGFLTGFSGARLGEDEGARDVSVFNAFLDALQRDVGGDPVVRGSDQAALDEFRATAQAADDARRLLDELGIDPAEELPAVRARIEELAAEAPPRDPVGARAGRAAAMAEEAEAAAGELDAALEAEIRAALDDPDAGDMRFELEFEEAQRRMSAREVFDTLEEDEQFARAIDECLGLAPGRAAE